MFHLIINPSVERIWRLAFETADGKRYDAVDVKAFTFQDAMMDWWENGLAGELLPHDVEIELSSTIGGVLTFYLENDMLVVSDVTKDFDPDSISCSELVERRKQERLNRKARK